MRPYLDIGSLPRQLRRPFGWALIHMTDVFIKREHLYTDTRTQGECPVKRKAEVKGPGDTYDRRRPLQLRQRHGETLPLPPRLRRHQACRHLDLGLAASRTETIHSCCSSHEVWHFVTAAQLLRLASSTWDAADALMRAAAFLVTGFRVLWGFVLER